MQRLMSLILRLKSCLLMALRLIDMPRGETASDRAGQPGRICLVHHLSVFFYRSPPVNVSINRALSKRREKRKRQRAGKKQAETG